MQFVKKHVVPYVMLVLASAIYAVGFNWCYAPNRIGFGGITGVGQIINAALPWAPVGVVVILLNIPLFLLGWRWLGGHLLFSSLFAMFVSSVFIDLLAAWHTFDPMEPMLASIFGGLLLGLSLGLVFLQGATTGGTDLCARLDLPLEETVAAGDSANDLSMLRTAGLGVCMANGTEDAKAAADRVIGDVREDGLAALIEELWFDGPKAEPSGRDLGSAWAQIESAGGQ